MSDINELLCAINLRYQICAIKKDVGRMEGSYLKRSREFDFGLENSSTEELKKLYGKNILATRLVINNITELLDVSYKFQEEIMLKASKEDTIITNNVLQNTRKIHDDFDNLNDKVGIEGTLLYIEADQNINVLKSLEQKSKLREVYAYIALIGVSKSLQSADTIFKERDLKREKNAAKILLAFLLGLTPFISGADAINQIVNSEKIALDNANTFIDGLNSFWDICFSHAISTEIIIFILQSAIENKKGKADANACIKRVESKYLSFFNK